MTTTDKESATTSPRRPSPRAAPAQLPRHGDKLDGTARAVTHALGRVAGGTLADLPFRIQFWDGSRTVPTSTAVAATVIVRDRSAVAQLLREPNQLGLARAWVEGTLDVDGDLETILALRGRYRDLHLTPGERARLAFDAVRIAGPTVLRQPQPPAIEARPHGAKHSIGRDRAAIHHHYDLSNRFYELLLGPTMVYSCAYFEDPDDSLETAQERKLETICRKLQLHEDERLLDIGCGWGSLLLHAAIHHGVRGVGVTLSEAQAELANRRIADMDLSDRVQIRVGDYRELDDGPFDKIASVGMYEHVGRAELGRYIGHVHQLLKPGGLFLNHGIARLRNQPSGKKTFINRYIFPDGELHPVTDVMEVMQDSGFEIRDLEALREHYPLTLRRWLANLDAHSHEAHREIGAPRARAWRLYLLASAQAFEAGEIGVFQILTARDDAPHHLPLSRSKLLAARQDRAAPGC